MTKDNDKLKVLPGTSDKVRAQLESEKRNMPLYAELVALQAQRRKVSYDAYIKAGFTKEQALELCKTTI